MKKKKNYLSDLHFEHKSWVSELSFQKDELAIFKNRLDEVIPRYTKEKVLGKAEQLQNKLIVHNEAVDTLLHDINKHEHELSTFAKAQPVAVDHVHFDDHTGIRDRVEIQRTLYAKLKKKIFRFLTEAM